MALFDGDDYNPIYDKDRLLNQSKRINGLMFDGAWRTLREISHITGAPEASVSAQLRNLRKAKWGSHTVERRRRGDPYNGLFEYRVIINKNEHIELNF